MNNRLFFWLTCLCLSSPLQVLARGEWWVVPQPKPPPVATLTNDARYLEWKWRTDVSDPATGLTNAALKAGVRQCGGRSARTRIA